ncbi:hypothetical protein [Nocardiopsis chromatogenes]|uniref:hypothetical protein n=1 Tax=Nocardiopsis chromatogenes TaxID=280239 RepID=UPI0006867B11|nr:hypothetical protein [Nocardiopsis chromatogenes]
MSRNGRVLTALLAAAALAAALASLTWWAVERWGVPGWPPDPGQATLGAGVLALFVGLLLLAVLAGGSAGRRGATAERAKAEAEAAAAHRRRHVLRMRLPSARKDYPFLFSAVVCWRETGPADGAEGAAVCAIERRAREFGSTERPEDVDSAQFRLAAALGPEPGAHPGIGRVWAEEVRLELSPEDEERLNRLSDLRKREAVREEERAAERLEREYLSKEVFADPGSALLWWLARDPARVDEAADRIGTLAKLSSAATGRPLSEVHQELAEAAEQDDVFAGAVRSSGWTAERGAPSASAPSAPPPSAASVPADAGADPFGPGYAERASAPGMRDEDPDRWLKVAGAVADDWEDDEEYEGFLQRFAVFLQSNGYTASAVRLRRDHGLGAGFAHAFDASSDLYGDSALEGSADGNHVADRRAVDERMGGEGAFDEGAFDDGGRASGHEEPFAEEHAFDGHGAEERDGEPGDSGQDGYSDTAPARSTGSERRY